MPASAGATATMSLCASESGSPAHGLFGPLAGGLLPPAVH